MTACGRSETDSRRPRFWLGPDFRIAVVSVMDAGPQEPERQPSDGQISAICQFSSIVDTFRPVGFND